MDFFDDSSDDGLSIGGGLAVVFGFGAIPYLAWALGFQHGKDVGMRQCAAPPAIVASAPAGVAPMPVIPQAASQSLREAGVPTP